MGYMVYHLLTLVYKQPDHKRNTKDQCDEILEGILSFEQMNTSKSGVRANGDSQ